jgi:hypothetical protein
MISISIDSYLLTIDGLLHLDIVLGNLSTINGHKSHTIES